MLRRLGWVLLILGLGPSASALEGRVVDASGAPVVGAWVTASRGAPAHSVTVFSDAAGGFQLPAPSGSGPLGVRVRRIGFRDLERADVAEVAPLALRLERESDPAAAAAGLPANRWYALVLDRVRDPV